MCPQMVPLVKRVCSSYISLKLLQQKEVKDTCQISRMHVCLLKESLFDLNDCENCFVKSILFYFYFFQTYNGQNENNEDYEIPPITPPNLPDPSLLHLVDHETGYHSLCHGLPPNSLIPAYSYQNMDLPAIMVSNMLSQDGHLLSSQLPTVSSASSFYALWYLQ